MENNPSRFVRWQSITRDYFTVASSIVLGLSTGLLAFVAEHLFAKPLPTCALVLGIIGVVTLLASIVCALYCSINRLRDFRKTAQIARQSEEPAKSSSASRCLEEDRRYLKILGDRSWLLFWWQVTLFGIGATAAVLALALHSAASV